MKPDSTKADRKSSGRARSVHRSAHHQRHGRYLLAEELVLRTLGQELGVEFKRDMKVLHGKTPLIVDAVAEGRNGEVIAVEVKYLVGGDPGAGAVGMLLRQAEQIYTTVRGASGADVKLVLAVVTDDAAPSTAVESQLRDELAKRQVPVELRLFTMQELEQRYL